MLCERYLNRSVPVPGNWGVYTVVISLTRSNTQRPCLLCELNDVAGVVEPVSELDCDQTKGSI